MDSVQASPFFTSRLVPGLVCDLRHRSSFYSLPRHFRDVVPASLKISEARRLGPSNALADLLEVLSVEANKIAKRFSVSGRRAGDGSPRSMRRSTSSAQIRILEPEKRLVHILSFAPHLDPPRPELSLVKVAKTCALPVQ